MVDCSNCVRKEHCDLWLESKGHPNKDVCLAKTWRNEDGTLDNNTRRYLEHEEIK